MEKMEKIISLCKRRGFVFPSSEIYGGFSSCYDFGPLGVEMKNNIKKLWWNEMIKNHENIVGLDAAILMSPKTWQASGHLTAGFADELIECKSCHKRFKADELQALKNKEILEYLRTIRTQAPELAKAMESQDEKERLRKLLRKCPECNEFIEEPPRKFNLMMKSFVGPVEDEAAKTYLRAETCQGIYVNFLNVLNSMRAKIPFGIAQIGKAFRNEITPGNFIFRIREFEQMEMQWFCSKKDANKFFGYWKKERKKWYISLGIKKENLREVEIDKKERAHYAKRQVDIEYNFPFGWREIEGIHNRGDWDLSNHQKYSGKDLRYFDEESKKKYFPYIVETSVGVDRIFLAFLIDSYQEIRGGRTKTTKAVKEREIVLRINRKLAPIKVAILPLVKNKPKIIKKAREVLKLLSPYFITQYDEIGSVGRRYRRQDEVGTPYVVTVDFQTLEDNTVTIRDRDTMKQERAKIEDLKDKIDHSLNV